MADVSFVDVDKFYDNGVQAVFSLSIDVADGEFLALVGPSGCGKTTALRMVAGLEEISGGSISIGGRVVNDVSPKDRDIAMVFQNYALYPHLSVKENIAFGMRLRKTKKSVIEERLAWAAELLGLTPYLDRKPRELSGGQRQRVAMGRAIVRYPQVFLMDEPLSNLDAKLRVQMRADIAGLQSELGTTTIYVTHDQVEAMTMGHRVAVMNKGVLQQVDAPQRLYDTPMNLFVAGFIGTPPMNLLEALVTEVTADGRVTIELGGQSISLDPAAVLKYTKLRDYKSRTVTVGIRPTDLHPPATNSFGTIRARVERVEPLGAESMVYLRIDARQVSADGELLDDADEANGAGSGGVVGTRPNLIGSFPPHIQLDVGDDVAVGLDSARFHFFDTTTGAPLRA